MQTHQAPPRYIMDYRLPAIHVPYVSQICFFLGPNAEGLSQDVASIQLVKTISRKVTFDIDRNQHFCEVICHRINVANGETIDTVSIKVTEPTPFQSIMPAFIPAVDTWHALDYTTQSLIQSTLTELKRELMSMRQSTIADTEQGAGAGTGAGAGAVPSI